MESEFPIVVMPFTMSRYVMLQRNLLYMGVTRAKKILVMIGEKKAITYAVKNETTTSRNTKLAERLKDLVPAAKTWHEYSKDTGTEMSMVVEERIAYGTMKPSICRYFIFQRAAARSGPPHLPPCERHCDTDGLCNGPGSKLTGIGGTSLTLGG